MSGWSLIKERIEEAIGGRDRALEFEKKTGIERKTVQGWIDGKLPQMRVFLQFCEKVGKPPAWFFGDAEAEPPPDDPDDMVRIPYLDVVVSAGAGRVNDVVRALDHQPWPRVMIQQMGNWRKIQCVRCEGNSMEPGILSGALVFVERTENRVASRRPGTKRDIYVVIVGEDARVKRVDQSIPGFRALISDNQEHATEIYPAGKVKIVGRVVGWVNRL